MVSEQQTISRAGWGEGAWNDEPDRLEFESHGFPCLIVRREDMGHLCGYVAVPPGHPAHGKGHDDIDVDVHGGLTYASTCFGDICHKPKDGEPDDVYWLGFDCAHAYDLSPGISAITGMRHELDVYRDINYVKAEIENLAKQLKEMQ